MKNSLSIAFAVLATCASAATAQELTSAAPWADSARREIEAANLTADTTRFAAVRVLLERALTAYPDDALLLHYQGYALYREATLRMGRWNQDVGELLRASQGSLEASAETHEMPETLALLSAVLGQRIGSNPIRAMTLGPRSGSVMDRAVERGPDNPRVWLLRGIGAIFTPGMFGGGLDRAQRYLERAASLFIEDSPAPPLPAWGRAEVYIWLGQVHARAGREAEAREAYIKALEIEPDNGWVRHELLPALDR
ncbi:MAG: tetratricopeptide repeat protein [Longimicrobiales bacterium]